jgi:Ca2+-binding EF-hand superfamily protein
MESLPPEVIESCLNSNSSELQSVYHMLCKNSDGLLGHREVCQLLRGIGVKATAQELKDLITDVVGEEPKIDFNAFVVLMTRKYRQLPFDEEIDALFETLDGNKDGFVDAQDIVKIMQAKGVSITLGEAQSLLMIISDSQQGLAKDELKSFVQTKM